MPPAGSRDTAAWSSATTATSRRSAGSARAARSACAVARRRWSHERARVVARLALGRRRRAAADRRLGADRADARRRARRPAATPPRIGRDSRARRGHRAGGDRPARRDAARRLLLEAGHRRHRGAVRDRLPPRVHRRGHRGRLSRRHPRALVLRAPPHRRPALAQAAPRDAARVRARVDPHAGSGERCRHAVAAGDPARDDGARRGTAARADAQARPDEGGAGMTRVVIAGGGLAGQRTAEALRALGHDGPITMLAAERHAPYDRPPLSKAVLAGEEAGLSLRPESWHKDNGVELLTGTPATGLGPGRVHMPHGDVAYDELVIATGASPVTLPGLPHAQALRTLDDARALRGHLKPNARIAVIGAGLIGQEIASAAAAQGAHATLIDVSTRPFDALLGPGQGDWLRARHERAGVTLRLGRRLIATDEDALLLDDGTTVVADHVVVAIGVRPDLSWAGDTTGAHLAGDCTGSAHWEAAVRQANAVARAILG